MLYVEIDAAGNARRINYAPYLDYRPLAEGEPGIHALLARPECTWIGRDLEQKAQGYTDRAGVVRIVRQALAVMGKRVEQLASAERRLRAGLAAIIPRRAVGFGLRICCM
jgi:hypothetical protein